MKGIEYVGFWFVFFGISASLSAFLVGHCVKYVGRVPFFLTAFSIIIGLHTFMLYWRPQPSEFYIVFLFPIFYGLCEGVWSTQINCNFFQKILINLNFMDFFFLILIKQLLQQYFDHKSKQLLRIIVWLLVLCLSQVMDLRVMFFRFKKKKSLVYLFIVFSLFLYTWKSLHHNRKCNYLNNFIHNSRNQGEIIRIQRNQSTNLIIRLLIDKMNVLFWIIINSWNVLLLVLFFFFVILINIIFNLIFQKINFFFLIILITWFLGYF